MTLTLTTKRMRVLKARPAQIRHAKPGACIECDHAEETGGWATNGITHCRECGMTWPLSQTRLQHCTTCHETFGGDEAATRHQGAAGCVNPRRIRTKAGALVLSQRPDGVWVRGFGA